MVDLKEKCCIISGSPCADFPENFDFENCFIYCADGGYRYAEKFGIKPDILIGDFDTCPEALESSNEIKRYKPEKDETDTMLAVLDAEKRGFKEINILAALGGRFDHTFANIQTLAYVFSKGMTGYILDKKNIITMQKAGREEYLKKEGYYFSLFAYENVENLTIKGAEYNAENIDLKQNFPLGVSNKITDEKCIIEFKSGILLVIFSKD